MKIKNYGVFFFLCALLLLCCENQKQQDVNSNPNRAETNLSKANDFEGNALVSTNKNSVNENTDVNSNQTAKIEDEDSDFIGTAGNTEKKNEINGTAVLREIRTAEHGNYDRIVFEFIGAQLPGYHIEYIDKPVRACGSGNVVSLKGDAWLEVRFTPSQAHDENGKPTIKGREQTPKHKTIKELKLTCDFEADVTSVLGVASPNKYRVLELNNPTRLAIDIKH